MLPLQVTIDSVERCAAPEGLVAHFGIDAPKAGRLAGDQNLLIAGWVVGAQGVRIRCIQVFAGEQLLKRAPVNVPRPDVLVALQETDVRENRIGFHFEVGTVGLAAGFALDIEVFVGDDEHATSIRLCRVSARKRSNLSLQSSYDPLQVTAMGRSGTTLLMQMLAQHPQIVVTNFYPYELRQANYWLHFFMVASAPADFEASAHPDQFSNKRLHIGHNPYSHPSYIHQYKNRTEARQYYTDGTFRALAQFCVSRIDEYYDLVARQEGKPAAKVFAEKVDPGMMQNICRDLYTRQKEVILTRDFRDVLCSAKSFNAKRNQKSFGGDRVNDDFQWVDTFFAPGASKLYEAWQQRGSTALLVRYEDLIRCPEEQIERLLSYLDLEGGAGTVSRIVDAMVSRKDTIAAHSTTSSAEASIGRWKRDLPEELQDHFKTRLGHVLEAFGYD